MNLPHQFISLTQELLGQSDSQNLIDSLIEERPISIRLNQEKLGRYKVGITGEGMLEIPWCRSGYYLDTRPTFTYDPLFHSGAYYVQEASSMFIEQIVKQHLPHKNIVALDLCAAPGGKTTLLRSLLPSNSLLIANEIVRKRAQILSENLLKWGHPDVIVTNNSSEDFSEYTNMFDLIVADVPCSGEGMFRKDEGAIAEWSVENVDVCWKRQRDIISSIWHSLKPGGLLIYSTCTYNTKENEENVAWILDTYGAQSLPVQIEDSWNITRSLYSKTLNTYRFMPHKTKGEGFFVSVIQKPLEEEDVVEFRFPKEKGKSKKRITAQEAINNKIFEESINWINNSNEVYDSVVYNDTLFAFPKLYMPYLQLYQKEKMRIVHAGTPIAYIKGKACIPHHALALSNLLQINTFVKVEICYEQAIAYLRKEAITLPAMTSKGFVILTYKNMPLGFVKSLGNRSNNLYPTEWRIRSGYMPQQLLTL